MTAVNIFFHPFMDVQNVLFIHSPIKKKEKKKNRLRRHHTKGWFSLLANVYKNTVLHLCDR